MVGSLLAIVLHVIRVTRRRLELHTGCLQHTLALVKVNDLLVGTVVSVVFSISGHLEVN